MFIRSEAGLIAIPVRLTHDMVVYLDEFGQNGKKGKFGLGMLLLPKPGVPLLQSLTSRVVADVRQRYPNKKSVKARDWCEKHRLELCDLIRQQQWILGADCRDLSHPDWHKADPNRERLFGALAQSRHLFGLPAETVGYIRELYAKHHPYIDQFYDRLKVVVNQLADDGILIRSIEFVADERLAARLSQAMEFYAWVWLSRRYPHFEQPSRYGVDYRLIEFRSASDEAEPNLIAADAVTHWWGMTQLDERYVPGGRAKYQAYLDRADCVKFDPSAIV